MWILNAIKWAYSDSLKAILFMASAAAFAAFLMTFIAYPWETITTLFMGFVLVVLFLFVTEYN